MVLLLLLLLLLLDIRSGLSRGPFGAWWCMTSSSRAVTDTGAGAAAAAYVLGVGVGQVHHAVSN
jgi:hypothetical protein